MNDYYKYKAFMPSVAEHNEITMRIQQPMQSRLPLRNTSSYNSYQQNTYQQQQPKYSLRINNNAPVLPNSNLVPTHSSPFSSPYHLQQPHSQPMSHQQMYASSMYNNTNAQFPDIQQHANINNIGQYQNMTNMLPALNPMFISIIYS